MPTDSREYFRHTVVISSLTLVSRILGVARDMACAGYFGAGLVWDAFSFAVRIPSLVRKVFGEGALSAAFIPVFTEYLELRDRKDAWQLAGIVFTAVGALLLACLLLGESIVLIIPRTVALSDRWRLALALTAVMLPYMVFICLTALAGGVLNSLRHFVAPAFSPIMLNATWIIAVVVVAPAISDVPADRAFVLAVGVLVAGLFQFLLQLWPMHHRGFRWKLRLDVQNPGLRRIATTMAPIVLALAAVEVNVVLDGIIAISLSAPEGKESFTLFGASLRYPMEIGANSVLYYGNRLMQFPLGVFGIALATAVFPTLSARAARKDWDGFAEALTDGLAAVVFIGLPAGVGLMALARPAVELFFERGQFTAQSSARTAFVLSAYCTGMWAYCALHVLARAFYSLQDTRTPAKTAAAMVVLNLTLNLTLIWSFREAGLAFATAASAAVQSVVLYLILVRRVHLPARRRLLGTLLKTCAATAAMLGAAAGTLYLLPPAPQTDEVGLKLIRLFAPFGAGMAAFLASSAALRVREMSLLLAAVGLRRKAG